MLDIKYIRDNTKAVKKAVELKNIKVDIDELLKLDKDRSALLMELESLRAERNQNAATIKIGGKPDKKIIDKGRELKQKVQEKEEQLRNIDSKINLLMAMVPMVPSKDTPVGPDDSGNVEVRRWNNGSGKDPKAFDFQIKDHIELGEDLDLIDLERGVKASGFRGYYLKNEGALMHLALMRYAIDKMLKQGFKLMVPPTLVREEVLFGSGHFPFDTENVYVADSMLHTKQETDQEKKFLVGTSEPSLLYYHANETLEEEELPVKYVGYSQCYRSEIGSYGKDTKGLYRIHEFLKVEQVLICQNDMKVAEKWHQTMVEFAEELLQELKLPYRVIQVCTGDMGAGKYKMYDIETWMPSRDAYGETHSASNLLDWQANRLNLKVRGKDGKKYAPYTLNNTVVASPRILIALWENYQQEDGSIKIPEALVPYMGLEVIKKED